MRKKNLPWSEISRRRQNLWVKMQKIEWVKARSNLKRREGEREFGEMRKANKSATVPHLNANSRLSEMSVRGKIKKSRPGETLSLKSPLVQGILAQASHYSLKRVYQKNWMAQVLHISPRRDMFSLGEILCSFGKFWFCHFSNFCSTSPHLIHDPFNPNNSKTHIKPYFSQFSIIPKGFTSTNSKSSF